MAEEKSWNRSLTNLNTVLAGMIPFREESYAIASKAGLRVENITFSEKPSTNWFYIIQQARHQEKITQLIDEIEAQFGDSPVLQRARADVLTAILGPGPGSPEPSRRARAVQGCSISGRLELEREFEGEGLPRYMRG